MFPHVEGRYLQAVVVLAEELNFTRAAHILRISQPALSKQINELEDQYQVRLFVREKGRIIDLTDAGRAFVEEARSALFHTERAIHLARAAHEGTDSVLMVGHSHHANQEWIATMLAIRLPLYPKLKVRFATRFAMELIRGVLAGELSLALVTAPPEDAQITAVPFARAPLYAALPEDHPAVQKDRLLLRDLRGDEWIVFARQVHPVIHDAILETARLEAIVPKNAHETFTAHQAVYLVSEHAGVAIFAEPPSIDCSLRGVAMRPLSDKSLCFDTCLIMRADQGSRAVNEFGRAFLKNTLLSGCRRVKWICRCRLNLTARRNETRSRFQSRFAGARIPLGSITARAFRKATAVARRFHFRARMMRSVQISMFSEFQSSLCAKVPDFRREIEVE